MCLICAAAIPGPIGPFVEQSPKAWVDTIHTNLLGVMNALKAVLPHMIARREGKIIVLSGPGATGARPNLSAYAASKAAVVRLVETVAEEVREHNVQINCMGPGGTYTHMTDEILRAGERAGWKETEEALQIRRDRRSGSRETNSTGAVPGFRAIQSHQRQTDPRLRRLEKAPLRKHPPGDVHAAPVAEGESLALRQTLRCCAHYFVGQFADGTGGYAAALVENAELARHAARKRQLLLHQQHG